MRRFGCLAVLFVIALLSVEFYVLLLAMEWMKSMTKTKKKLIMNVVFLVARS